MKVIQPRKTASDWRLARFHRFTATPPRTARKGGSTRFATAIFSRQAGLLLAARGR